MYMLEYIERFIRNPSISILDNKNVMLYPSRDWLEVWSIKILKAYKKYITDSSLFRDPILSYMKEEELDVLNKCHDEKQVKMVELLHILQTNRGIGLSLQ